MKRKPFSFRACHAGAIFALAVVAPAFAQTSNGKGKISRNFYRIPYGNNLSVRMNQDYVDHGNTPAGDTGSMDMADQTANTPFIVAAAAGTVIGVSDNLNGCGCNSAYGPCANAVQIQHINGEISTYLHIAQNSATSRGIANNLQVNQGTIIGVEGDVGWTCGGGSNPRTSSCVPSVPPGTGNCGPHLHWNVVRQTTGERVNPMTCGISNNIYVDDATYATANCSSAGCADNVTIPVVSYNAFGIFRVFQANNNIDASLLEISNFGSVVLHAGNKVRLMPGFHATGPGYFRAEVGNCNTTATAPTNTATSDGAVDLWTVLEGLLELEASGY